MVTVAAAVTATAMRGARGVRLTSRVGVVGETDRVRGTRARVPDPWTGSVGRITAMTAADSSQATPGGAAGRSAAGGRAVDHRVRVLVYSDDVTTREAVKMAVGRRPSRDVEVESWVECATADAVFAAAAEGGLDVFVLDGEAVPYGGLGVCRELKFSVYQCPPVIVLTGRPQDGWLASWSYADHAVPHPVDPLAMADAVAKMARERSQPAASGAR